MISFFGTASRSTQIGMAAAVDIVGCELEALRAVVQVETGLRGFDAKERPKALFEPHVFYRLLKKRNDSSKLARAERAGLAYSKWGTRPYPADSYPRISAACRIDEECALQATSWGLPQILGLNHAAAGYENVVDMVTAFCEGEDAQLIAMARFIVAMGLDDSLKRKNWATFAKGYNGPSYAKHGYHKKLARSYAHFAATPHLPKPDPLTPEVRNVAQATRKARVAGASAAVALSAMAGAPVAATTADAIGLGPSVTMLVAVGLVILAVSAGVLAGRASRHARAFQ